MTLRPCIECGTPDTNARCAPCAARVRRRRGRRTPEQLGYDETWRTLSRRARRLQPWCSDCGTSEDLTTDHSPQAWERKKAGKVIRLEDVDVVCRVCNSRRGPARTWGDGVSGWDALAPAKAESQSEITEALDVFDALNSWEFGFIASLVRPRGITREEYRQQLEDGHFDPQVFMSNVSVMHSARPKGWGLKVTK